MVSCFASVEKSFAFIVDSADSIQSTYVIIVSCFSSVAGFMKDSIAFLSFTAEKKLMALYDYPVGSV